ncbi:hypothetical protein AVEN_74116-1 [Araneus ventricosus]|uniref:Uncharacterized protein n=1 Tax=Araneus ventricosus TaxID=182803 RepID=A0A4Y2PMG3_ARAVE|nr:hypothetical protein AVEN_74116-1 [Araneus ventricosus]
MGVIQIITPKSSVLAEEPLSRTKQVIPAKDFAAEAHVPIQVYHNYGVVGYSKITAQNFAYESDTTASILRKIDMLWLYGKWNNLSLPGWNGYIERLSSNSMEFSISRILFLPFIPQPASVYNTIYTILLCALENAKPYGHDVCIVIFDQTLYTKAPEILAAAPEGSDLLKIVIRLGVFHLLSSFFGAIGYIMQGSVFLRDLYKDFSQGYKDFRSAQFSCGTSTDMIIEQSLMKSMQTDGGISRGRSTQESVISKLVYSMHAMNTVCERLEDLGNVKTDTTHKHVDASDSRVKRYTEDIIKLLEWFLLHELLPVVEKIISIAKGIVGDEKIVIILVRLELLL